ncbi:methylaspartate mutase [Nocardia jejuensis]|uniref:methylaspartate mutase n=1 Tax=Nocardia jejuensis TaxID=328049 RepID=UPI0008349120|nr:methylaspartate mutase [Nocardia jejuensis]
MIVSAGEDLPSLTDTVRYIEHLDKHTVFDTLTYARQAGRFAIQPRCGVGGHEEMRTLLHQLTQLADPDVLSLTIDSHTRLQRFDSALRCLNTHPETLNGYPLVTHGWRHGRDLNESIAAPLEIRHGSPDARILFDVAIASGITSFEGGGISYNLPYSKDVPLARSLAAWREVDERCGRLAEHGVVVDRELFGTLTAVLVPPSISLAISMLEAISAASAGVKCISVAYPQGGNLEQDVAALQAISILSARYLPDEVSVFPVLHEFMGAFPRTRDGAEALILYGAFAARLGGAAKLITKTYQEAAGIPDVHANAAGIRLARLANAPVFEFAEHDTHRCALELEWIVQEVDELIGPLLHGGLTDAAIVDAFANGTLDIPFSASRHAHSAVIPRRDRSGAVRYHDAGALGLSARTRRRHQQQLDAPVPQHRSDGLFASLKRDIDYFITMLDPVSAPSRRLREAT